MNDNPAASPEPELPPTTPGPPPPHSGSDSFFDGIRRTGLVRADERWIGGVGGGVALRLGIDPLVVRGLLGVSVLLGGVGLVLYGLAWLLLPEQRDGRIHLQQLFRGDFDVAVLGGFAVFVTGLSFPDRWVPGLWWVGDGGWWTGLLWLGALVVVVVLVTGSNRGARSLPPTSPGAPTPPYAGPNTPPSPTYASAAPRRPEGPTTTMYPTPPRPATPATPATPAASYPTATYPTASYPPAGPPPHHPGPTGPYPTGLTGPTGPMTSIPRPPRTRGPGRTAVGIVVALSLLTFAGLLYAERADRFDGPVLLVTGAVALVLAGLGIIVSGLRGRSSGALGGLAVIAIIATVPLSAIHEVSWGWDGPGTAFGEMNEQPHTVAVAEAGYRLGAGDVRIDLTELPDDDEPIVVPVRVGAGDVRIIMPADGAYSGNVQVFAGKVDWLGSSVTHRADGGSTRSYESPAVAAGAEPDLVLDVTVGAGELTVVEE